MHGFEGVYTDIYVCTQIWAVVTGQLVRLWLCQIGGDRKGYNYVICACLCVSVCVHVR